MPKNLLTIRTWTDPRLRFSSPPIAILYLVLFLISDASTARSQSLGDRNRETTNLHKSGVWHQLKNDIRFLVEPIRAPKYSFAVLRGAGQVQEKPFSFDDLPVRLVVILAGLHTNRSTALQFAEQIISQSPHAESKAYAVFEYPNDGPIMESATVFREYLRELYRKSPTTHVTIVAHSMGGLIARYALEEVRPEPRQDCGVDRLVMIFPPNRGSLLAQYADVLELPDLLDRLSSNASPLSSIMDSLVHDGVGEACDDLIPGSTLLQTLNGNSIPKIVRYSIAVGTAGPISPTQRLLAGFALGSLRSQYRTDSAEIEWLIDQGEELLRCDELTQGCGDGAVAVHSARLPGVRDVAEFPLHHIQWCDPKHEAAIQLRRWVIDRLE